MNIFILMHTITRGPFCGYPEGFSGVGTMLEVRCLRLLLPVVGPGQVKVSDLQLQVRILNTFTHFRGRCSHNGGGKDSKDPQSPCRVNGGRIKLSG